MMCLTSQVASAVYETDWLASTPVFYNERTGAVSHNVNDVIDFANVEFHPEGLRNFLDFGYSVLGQTPLRDVRFLRHSSRLTVHTDGQLEIVPLPDPVDDWLGRTTNEEDVIDLIRESVRSWEDSVDGEIVIPTSGGYDSRLLNLFIRDKSRIRSFTYGLSKHQSRSREVVLAKALSSRLGTRWEQIPIGEFHKYLDDWLKLYGIATHAHGMYQIEFYRKVRDRVPAGVNLLSGIIGDAWAGSVNVPLILSERDLTYLGYTHGMRADGRRCFLPDKRELRAAYFHENAEKLCDPRFRVVEAMRFKMMLLSYLLAVPRSLGFEPWSPFLIPEIALGMLMLPDRRREKRAWQADLFRKHHIDFETRRLHAETENTLNLQVIRRCPPPSLGSELLREVFDPGYVEWINRRMLPPRAPVRCVRGAARRLGLKRLLGRWADNHDQLTPYFAYLCLKPIEDVLQRRSGSVASQPTA